MKIKLILLTFLLILFTAASAFCEISIKAEVDKAGITSDDNITYKLTIVSSDKNIPAPERPKFAGFNILSQAQSSTVSLVNGKIKSIIVYAYLLEPGAIGKIRIEPAKIKIKNETQSTTAFEIEIKQGKKSIPLPEQNPSQPQEGLPESKEPQITI